MFAIYFLVIVIHAKISWSYLLVLPFDDHRQASHQIPQNLQNVGKPLILTPYLKSNRTLEARNLSSVESLIENENIISNAGYFTVDEKYNSNLFFWFFRQTSSNWTEAPLILWLQGGPGCSSMYGLFEENGPYVVTKDKLKKREYSWTNDYNVIYIDQPVGTGFSFRDSVNGSIHTQEEVAEHLYKALAQFFQLYPELSGNAFYITGESYAGRYIPAIGYKIHTMKKANLTDFNLKGLFMISALTEGSHIGLSNFCFEIGLIDSRTKTSLKETEQKLKSFIDREMWTNATESIMQLFNSILNSSHVDLYNFIKPDKGHIEKYYVSFLNKSETRKKIHVGNVQYRNCSDAVFNDFHEDISKSVVPWVEELVEHYPLAFVGGQFDVRVPYPMVLNVIENLNWSGASKYKNAVRKIFNKDTLDGYIKSAGNLKDILIRNAGHMVPGDQPRASLDLLNKFVNDEL